MSAKNASYLQICRYCGAPFSEHVPDAIKRERRAEREKHEVGFLGREK
jgi:hypothetical protein